MQVHSATLFRVGVCFYCSFLLFDGRAREVEVGRFKQMAQAYAGTYKCNCSHMTPFRVVFLFAVLLFLLFLRFLRSVVQRHVTRPFRVAPERVHKSHFRS
jgi:hypothetical protein